jgi:integrase
MSGPDFDPLRNQIVTRSSYMTGKTHFNNLHPASTRALEADPASRPPGVDRLFPGSTNGLLRAAIHKACGEAGVSQFSPYRLRHRRISLLRAQDWGLEAIGEFVAQRFSTIERAQTHLMLDTTEVDYERLLGTTESGLEPVEATTRGRPAATPSCVCSERKLSDRVAVRRLAR